MKLHGKLLSVTVFTTLLAGCQAAGTVMDGFRCADYCIAEFTTGEDFAEDRFHAPIVMFSPRLDIEVRDASGQKIDHQSGLDDNHGTSIAAELERFAESYRVRQYYRGLDSLTEEQQIALSAAFDQLFSQAVQPDALWATRTARLIGAPEMGSPISQNEAPVMTPLQHQGSEESAACCALLLRITGWQYSRSAAKGKLVGDILSTFGSVTTTTATSDAVVDAMLVAFDSGEVLWSGRYLGPYAPQSVRMMVNRLYSSMSNAQRAALAQ